MDRLKFVVREVVNYLSLFLKGINNVYFWGIMAVLVYLYSPNIGLAEPLSFHQLFLFMVQLSSDQIFFLFNSMLTITGFLLAFSFTVKSQIKQKQLEYKVESAKRFRQFVFVFSKLVYKFGGFSSYLIDVVENGDIKSKEDWARAYIAVIEGKDLLKNESIVNTIDIKYSFIIDSMSTLIFSQLFMGPKIKKFSNIVYDYSEKLKKYYTMSPFEYLDYSNNDKAIEQLFANIKIEVFKDIDNMTEDAERAIENAREIYYGLEKEVFDVNLPWVVNFIRTIKYRYMDLLKINRLD